MLTGKPNYPEGKISDGYHACGCQSDPWEQLIIHRVPLFPRGRNSSLRLLINYLSFVLSGVLFAPWLLRKRQYDVIFVYGLSPIFLAIPALFIGWLKGKKVVLWVQDLWPESLSATGYIHNRYIIGAVRHVVRFIYHRSDLLLVQSRAFEESVQSMAPDANIVYYPNSVDSYFSVPSQSEPPAVPGLGDGFSVMFAGNIGAAQGVDVIVEAASLLEGYADIHFVILGDGSCRAEMLDKVRQRGLTNLSLPGRFPEDTMPGFMQKASVLLVTLTDQPIFAVTVPNKVQAYMASGRPIIACLNGEGARLVVEAQAGLVAPAGDAQALADVILRLYRLSPTERQEMGENGRRYYQQHFDHDHLVARLVGYLQAVSNGRKVVQ